MMVDGGKAFLLRMVGMIKWNKRSMDMASLELPFVFQLWLFQQKNNWSLVTVALDDIWKYLGLLFAFRHR
jgi:hypothetical protein